ncbi:hypothetical protein HZ326_21206 [Fusarium oxysporum f. sp. albedinis]|nr:hypothetical protein HZ326_21206 [Fusarium oxysporum f. sp. albedinis]
MPRGKGISPSIWTRICELRRQGLKYAHIKKHFPETHLDTTKTTLRRKAQRVPDSISLPRSDAPPKLTEEQRDRIYNTVTTDPHVTMEHLLDPVGNVIKLSSLRYLLREMKRKWQARKPL